MSVFVKRYNCKETIASACASVKPNFALKLSFALRLSFEARIVSITWSKIDNAFFKPSTIC